MDSFPLEVPVSELVLVSVPVSVSLPPFPGLLPADDSPSYTVQ